MMRLQKFLAHAGVCSRRKAEEFIAQNRVKINGHIVSVPGTKVDLQKDIILFDDKQVVLKPDKKKLYIALNKPEGYITSCSQKNSKIIMELIDIKDRIYPIGRLDKDSKGLILLTNDGELHNRLSHPSFNHEKEYIVTTRIPVSDSALNQLRSGIYIDDRKTRRTKIKRLAENKFKIVLKEGRNRQIRKMVAKIHNKVDILKRIRISNINLGDLNEGQWRYLSEQEVKKLRGSFKNNFT